MNFLKPVVSASVLFASLLTGNAMFAQTLPNTTTPTCSYQTGYGLTEAKYQTEYNKYIKQGYQATWVDGHYDTSGKAYISYIAKKCTDSNNYVSQHGLTGEQYKKSYQDYQKKGYRVYQVDSYLSGGQIRYAVVYVKDSNKNWKTYYYQPLKNYQEYYNKHIKEGYYLYNLSIVEYQGKLYFTSAYKKTEGDWYAKYGLTGSQYKVLFDRYYKAGWHLSYLDTYSTGGKEYYSAIFKKGKYSSEYAPYNLTGTQYKSIFDHYTYKGYTPHLVTGYYKGASYYAADFYKK